MSNESSFFGGQSILDGMPLRRAGTILYAIEGRTAQLVAQSRQALASYLTEKTAAEKEQAFLSAIAQGRDLPLQPTIQDIERFVPEWISLVPTDDNQRAALARKMGEKYQFRRQDVPALRKALGLDTDRVRQAYEHLFQKPVASIYTSSIPVSEKIRWLASRLANSLERMPPFWTAFSLTLTETVGGSILALPIALAGVGPLPGVILLVLLGLVNILTIMGIVEAITRNGNMRYGTAYFGRLVDDYLGKPGSILLVPVFLILSVLLLVVYYVGISTSLADITGVNPMLWAAVVFLVGAYFLRRESLSATVASALVIGMINILIILILSALALPFIQMANLQYINLPFGNGQAFNPKILDLVFGVVLVAYFGHTSVGSAAKVVLRRDPGGSSLIWGNIAAMITAIALYSLWVLAVNGAISSVELGRLTGTALSPLAAKIGGIVPLLGIIYVILAMGMGSVHYSYGLFYQVREALPSKAKRSVQFVVSLAPVFLLFLAVEWMLFTKRESFSGLLGFMGIFLIPIIGGIFPMLMLAASRRKGEYTPKITFGFLGNSLVIIIIYLIYLGSMLVYGIFIWEDPVQRIIAVGVSILMLIVTGLVLRQGAFVSRVVMELKVDASDTDERATLSLVDAGKPFIGTFKLMYANEERSLSGSEVEVPSYKQLRNILVEFSTPASSEIKVWLHRVTPEGKSEAIHAELCIKDGSIDNTIGLDRNLGYVLVPLRSAANRLEIELL